MESRIARQRRAEFFAAGVSEPERAVEAPLPDGERARALAKLYLQTFGKDSIGATLPSPEMSKGDLRRVAKLAMSGHASEKPTWPRRPLPEATAATMESRLLGASAVTPQDLQRLADARAEALKRLLVEVSGMPEARVFLKGAAIGADGSQQKVVCKLDLSD
jgi:hypothetical protein